MTLHASTSDGGLKLVEALPKKVIEIAQDINKMKIRGAGKIAQVAVEALKVVAESSNAAVTEDFMAEIKLAAKILLQTRPTAVSLPNGIRYVLWRLMQAKKTIEEVEDLKTCVINVADQFIKNSKVAIQKIGEIGARRVKDGDVILTHCHSSAVIAVIKTAWNQGKKICVNCTETRPLFQGRITARTLGQVGIPVTMIVDSATRHFINKVDKVIVGADAITANGAVVNKIGTSMIALVAHEARTPFFVAAETYKFSPETMMGDSIVLEERDSSEIISSKLLKTMKNVFIRNPSFDVTPAEYVNLIITEKGIIPPQGAVSIIQQEYQWFISNEMDTL
ncbi:ribose 1,5-bisphosphate isomerase [Candidatus Bathyarchaeota archaeon]|nr:ribose 1,5-bisphosphate isomerase [Candidatus Bathyarchaeota archaeon]